jgi:subtilisin-like proprotein convertase family protein
MANHSKKLRLLAAVWVAVCLFQYSTFAAAYYSFGRSVNKSFGPDNEKTTLLEDISIPIRGTILDLNLALDIEHPSVCDLKIYIINPAGSIAACINSYDYDKDGGRMFDPNRQDFYWTVFDAEAPISIDSGSSPFSGLFRPNGPDSLSSFYGQQSYGLWQVQVDDWIYGDTGIFKGVRLDFCIEPVQNLQLTPEPATMLLFCLGGILVFRRRKSTA